MKCVVCKKFEAVNVLCTNCIDAGQEVASSHENKNERVEPSNDSDCRKANKNLDVQICVNDVLFELRSAMKEFGPFASEHEGIAVIREEYLELEREVFLKQKSYRPEQMRKEAVQLAAMAIRFLVDCGVNKRETSS